MEHKSKLTMTNFLNYGAYTSMWILLIGMSGMLALLLDVVIHDNVASSSNFDLPILLTIFVFIVALLFAFFSILGKPKDFELFH